MEKLFSKLKKYKLIVSILCVSVLITLAISLQNVSDNNAGYVNEDLKYAEKMVVDKISAEGYVTLEYNPSYTLKEMVEKSDVIVKGKFFINYSYENLYTFEVEKEKKFGTYSENIERLSTDLFYSDFVVNEIYKGEIEKNRIVILIAIRDALKINNNEKYIYVFYDPIGSKAKIGQECILFLKKDEETGYYEYSTHPNLVKIKNEEVNLINVLANPNNLEIIVESNYSLETHSTYFIKMSIVGEKFNDTITGMKQKDFINELKKYIK